MPSEIRAHFGGPQKCNRGTEKVQKRPVNFVRPLRWRTQEDGVPAGFAVPPPRACSAREERNTESTILMGDVSPDYARLKQVEAARIRLVNSIAHELLNPLTPIKIQVQLLSGAGLLAEPERQRAIEIVRFNIAHLERLIRDLNSYARVESGHLTLRRTPVEVGALVESSVQAFEKLAQERGIRLEGVAPAGLVASADAGRITQVLYNLVANALKFTPPGGRVIVEGTRGNAGVVVSAMDTGSGLSPEEIGRLFQPFSQVHDRVVAKERGTGLGLFISKGIVEAHGGKIWAESPGPGKGARFSFSLPSP